MASNGFQTSYANERPPSSTGSGEADIASDPASSSFFMNDYKKYAVCSCNKSMSQCVVL